MIGIKNPPHKLKVRKKDIAPIGFFFDLFSNQNYALPILPIPMRIDKITNGEPTLFIYPDTQKLNLIGLKYNLHINFDSFFTTGIKNLVNTARKKYKEIIIHNLKDKFIIDWFEQSKLIEANIPSLTKDFTYLLSEFLKTYSSLIDTNNNSNQLYILINYCEKIIKYFKRRLKNNYILTINHGNATIHQFYKEKKGKIYPQIIPVSVYNTQSTKVKDMYFLPYLIYDDLIDVFFYNKQLLIETQLNVNLKMYQENGIINKRSNLDNFNQEKIISTIEVERFL